jgi:uncharacterized protein (DUF433 family)
MSVTTVTVSSRIYNILRQRAQQGNHSPDELAEALLAQHLLPAHPYVEVYQSRSGPRAVVKGTRVGVSTVVGYVRMGYDAETIASELLPHLTPAQIHDALSYYYDHRDEIDQELAEDSEAFWMEKLKSMMRSEEDFARITGRKV